MFPASSHRVPNQTSEAVNAEIRDAMEKRIARYRHASPGEIQQRLLELDREWDVERVLETNASTLAFIGYVLAVARNPKWIAVPMAVTAFLLQHAVQGWCPPLPILRRLGVRNMREIDEERFALNAIRGDFRNIDSGSNRRNESEILRAVQK